MGPIPQPPKTPPQQQPAAPTMSNVDRPGSSGAGHRRGGDTPRRPALPSIPVPPLASPPPTSTGSSFASMATMSTVIHDHLHDSGDADGVVIRKGVVSAARTVPVSTLNVHDGAHSVEPSPLDSHSINSGIAGTLVDEPAANAHTRARPLPPISTPPLKTTTSGSTTPHTPPRTASFSDASSVPSASSGGASRRIHHSQTMAQLMGGPSAATNPATDVPSNAPPAATSFRTMGPRPLQKRTASNPPALPMATLEPTPSSIKASLNDGTQVNSAHTSFLSVAGSDTTRRTNIPSATIRDLQATLKDLAALPTGPPMAAPSLPPLELRAARDTSKLFIEPVWVKSLSDDPAEYDSHASHADAPPLPSITEPAPPSQISAPPALNAPAGGMSKQRGPPALNIITDMAPPSMAELAQDRPPISPGMKHWHQVRQHILAPTPSEDRTGAVPNKGAQPPHHTGYKGLKYVTKAAERFGFRNAVENVMGVDRRGSQFGGYSFGTDLSVEEREDASRHRRRFARDIKICLDACAMDESARRLGRIAPSDHRDPAANDMGVLKNGQPPRSAATTHKSGTKGWLNTPTLHHHATHGPPTPSVHAQSEASTYAPLLMRLHQYLPDARAKRIWSRTCPHHAAILAELGVTFLHDRVSTDSERIQALEVFGTVVRNWATDSADEELDRWLWLCRAMLVNDKPLRQRGLMLLSQVLRGDPTLPEPMVRPMTADDFEAIAIALLRLLHAMESAPDPSVPQQEIVNGLLLDLSQARVVMVNTSTFNEISPSAVQGGVDKFERELLWMAAGRALAVDQGIASWLISSNGTVLKRFSPAPITSGSLPVMSRLRVISATHFFSSLSTVVRRTSNLDLVSSVAEAADYVFEDARSLIPDQDGLIIGYITVLLDIELKRNEARKIDSSDPFSEQVLRSGSAAAHIRLLQLLMDSPKGIVDKVAEQLVESYPTTQRITAVRYFLETELLPLGQACVPHLLQRLTPISGENKHVKPFLTWLSTKHSQLFYKPLFTCSAATQMATLTAPLRTVTTISNLVGPDRYWTLADPQMIVIVLMGGMGGTARKSYNGEIAVKPGRYATMLELVMALQRLDKSHAPKGNLRTFLTALEVRLARMLENEEKQGPLPITYRSLVCQLFDILRNASWWTKRTAATSLAVAWYSRSGQEIPRSATFSPDQLDDDQVAPLRDLLSVEDKDVFLPRLKVLDRPFITSLSTLLVTIQASLVEEDWAAILPDLWERYSRPLEPNMQMTFLIAKCAEQIPEVWNTAVMNDIFRSTDVTSPNRTLLKLSMLYGYRYQILAQPTIADDRGVFRFSTKSFELVATELGADKWVVPQDAQDQALQKYGQALPLELRQRLLELGWSEDKEMTTADYERIPVTLIPLTEMNDLVEGDKRDDAAAAPKQQNPPPSAAKPGLHRTVSNSSAVVGPKARRQIIPPALLAILNEQTRLLQTSDDVLIATLSYELIRMVERDDAGLLIRPINDNLPVDMRSVISRLNSDIDGVAPHFAYEAVNSLVGYLKTSVRDHPHFVHWTRILSTVTRIVPCVSEISLRDIRKTKAEAVLLPGSIYDDGAGFKLHAPWRNDNLPIQTAQLLLLTEILRANPRDVYLIKKLLFNLQVQASFTHLPFARAWLELVVQLFTGLNSNYNDRSEFRHFLNNIVMVLALHGKTDIIVAVQSMRAMSVCAVRFRRVFASIGFVDAMRTVYECYVLGHLAVKDCIEYGLRSIYRIHRDVFVYQLCLAIAEDPFDSEAAYTLLASLSVPNGPTSGVPSGIYGLNEKYEVDALVQMLRSGSELSLKDIGQTAEERLAQKSATLNLGPVLFPRDNIIRLLVTVIAVNAASPRAIRLLKLFASLVPYMDDPKSKDLLPEGIDAIGRFIHRQKMGDDQYMLRLLPGEETAQPDWKRAGQEYVLLVDAAVKNGCGLSTHATRRLLDIVLVLFQSQAVEIGPIASSVLGSLTNVHLAGRHPGDFLRDIAPTYRQTLATVDFSGVLVSITDLIRRSNYALQPSVAALVIHEYVAPVIRMLAFASEENMAFIIPVRTAAVDLIAAAIFLPGSEALDVLESVTSSPGLLASVILPLVLLLDKPKEINREEVYRNFWVRILRTVLSPMARAPRSSKAGDTPLALSAMSVLSLQVIKVIALRAPECISAIPGLWSYISNELLRTIADGDGRFYGSLVGAPRVVDWMMWSLFELLVLHRTPLHIDCRLRIQTVLSKMGDTDDKSSRPSSVASDVPRLAFSASPSRSLSGLVRRPTARRTLSANSLTGSNTTPDRSQTPIRGGHLREASTGSQLGVRNISGMGQLRTASSTSPSGASNVTPIRPSFADLSARRASRPTFDVFPDTPRNNRFPSSSPARALQVQGQVEKSAIVHLLGPATHLVSTTSAGPAVNVGLKDVRRTALRDHHVTNRDLADGTRRAVATVRAVYGYSTEGEDPMLQVWSVTDALRHITDQTRILVEKEFRDVFNPPLPQRNQTQALSSWTALNLAASGIEEKEGSFYTANAESKDDLRFGDGDGAKDLSSSVRVLGGVFGEKDNSTNYHRKSSEAASRPSFSFTLQSAYDEPSFQTFKIDSEAGHEEAISVPTLSISQC